MPPKRSRKAAVDLQDEMRSPKLVCLNGKSNVNIKNATLSHSKKNAVDKDQDKSAGKISSRRTRSSTEKERSLKSGQKPGDPNIFDNEVTISKRLKPGLKKTQHASSSNRTQMVAKMKPISRCVEVKKPTTIDLTNSSGTVRGKLKTDVKAKSEQSSKYFPRQETNMKRMRMDTQPSPRIIKKSKIDKLPCDRSVHRTSNKSSNDVVVVEDSDSDFDDSQIQPPLTRKVHVGDKPGRKGSKNSDNSGNMKKEHNLPHSPRLKLEDVMIKVEKERKVKRRQAGVVSSKASKTSERKMYVKAGVKTEHNLTMSPRLKLEDVVNKEKQKGNVKIERSSQQNLKRNACSSKEKIERSLKQSLKRNTCSSKGGKLRKKSPVKSSVKHQTDEQSSIPRFHPGSEVGTCESSDGESDSESDWEEVEDLPGQASSPEKKIVVSGPVEITLEAPNLMRKKKKKKFDMQEWFRLQMNRFEKQVCLNMHKVHLLCLLSHGFHRNRVCNSEILNNVAMSVVPPAYFRRNINLYDVDGLTRLTRWFASNVTIAAELHEDNIDLEDTLVKRFHFHRAASEVELVMMYVIILRALGADVRLIYSLQPMSHKFTSKNGKRKSKQQSGSSPDESKDENCSISSKQEDKKCETKLEASGASELCQKETPPLTPLNNSTTKTAKKKSGSNSVMDLPEKSQSAKGTAAKSDKKLKTKNSRPRRSASKVTPYIDLSGNDSEDQEYVKDVSDSDSSSSDANPRRKGKPQNRRGSKSGKKPSSNKKSSSSQEVEELSSGSDFEVQDVSFRRSPISSSSKSKKKNRKVLPSESDDDVQVGKDKVKKQGSDFWLEVYLEDKWMCVDCIRCRIDHPEELEAKASQPLCFVLAFDNHNCVKDVTQRYASNWATKTLKLRVVEDWWGEVLQPYRMRDKVKEKEEDLQLQAQLLQKPLPKSISEFKNHPLYSLRRHLLKFEAIYPESAVPLGFIREEPVYARECVRQLHTRETWMQEARVVRVGEKPYKIVKGRKRRKAFEGTAEPTAELFGHWQTEDFIPPPAVDGKVPRNEYGNVELFKPSMLPGGTVHLQQFPGLNRVAKKLGIDCVAAMKGWDHHSGFCHPILDGWVVCEEFKDVLIAAWDEDQEIQKQREMEKREKRVLGNWKLLIKGLLVKERLKRRFDLQPAKSEDNCSDSHATDGEKAMDAEMSWPRNLQSQQPSTSKDQDVLFPFEQI